MSNTKFLFSTIKVILLNLIQYTYIAIVLVNLAKKCFIIDIY
jgi:hypothetical protein